MMLEAARRAISRADVERAADAVAEAQRGRPSKATEHLRQEILGLAPYAVGARCRSMRRSSSARPSGERRYGIEVELSLEPLELSADSAGCALSDRAGGRRQRRPPLRREPRAVRRSRSSAAARCSRCSDDGHGFPQRSPLGERGARSHRPREHARASGARGRLARDRLDAGRLHGDRARTALERLRRLAELAPARTATGAPHRA